MRRFFQIIAGIYFIAAFSSAVSAAEAEDDFASRCNAAGVLFCVGFDDQSSVNALGPTQYPGLSGPESIAGDNGNPPAQAYPNNLDSNGNRYPAVDSSVAASGTGSMRLTANPIAAQAQSGAWYLGDAGTTSWPETFGAGSTFYFQYRARYDNAFADTDWSAVGGGGVKQFIMWRSGSSCTDLQLVLSDSGDRGYPQMYTGCGSVGFSHPPGTYSEIPDHIQWLYQHGPNQSGPASENDFACMRNFQTDETCGFFRGHTNQWWTYYYQITVGASGTNTSRVRAWVSRGPNEPMRQFIDWGPFVWDFPDGASFRNFMLTLYKTNKASANHAPATVWYDEFILSSQPIAIPSSVPGDFTEVVRVTTPESPVMQTAATGNPDPVDPDPVDPEPTDPGSSGVEPEIVDTGAGSMSEAAAAISTGQATDFSMPPPISENGLHWQTEGHYDATRNLVHMFGKAHGCKSQGCWDHFTYNIDTGVWEEVTAGIYSYTLEGHIYGNTAINLETGELFLHIPNDKRLKRYDPETRSWSSMDRNFNDETTEVTLNGLAYHPNLYGEGDGGLTLQGVRRTYLWRESTNTWTYQEASSQNSGPNGGVGVWFAAQNMTILGRNSSGGTRLVTPGPQVSVGTTPIQVGGLSATYHLPFGVIVQHPSDSSRMLLIEEIGNRVWESTTGGTWSLASYTHPFDTPDGAEVLTSINELGIIWGIGRDGNTAYSRIWRPQ